ncbi:hypothetical protein [Streptomyces sp. NPDC047065]|uniref:hypothetical protein n=1 Tax=Streptomyces sp. NPDC047065 TaxID=3154606 RepID=UPI0033ED12C8
MIRAGVVGGRRYIKDVGQSGDHLPETESVGRLSDVEDGTSLATRWVVGDDGPRPRGCLTIPV